MLAHLRHPHKDAEFCHPFFGITDSLGHHDAGILGASGEVDANHQYKLASTKNDGNMTNPCSGRNKSYLTSENQSTLYINLVYPPFFRRQDIGCFFFTCLKFQELGVHHRFFHSPVSENKLPRFGPFVSFMFSLFKAGDFCSRSCSVAKWWQLKYCWNFYTPIPAKMLQFDEHMLQMGGSTTT